MILDDLVVATERRITNEKAKVSLTELRIQAQRLPRKNPQLIVDKFLQPGLHFIGEIKKASPSKGIIVSDFPYVKIAQEYQRAQVDAISVLTEPDYFQGNLKYLTEISRNVDIPLLRKDFVIDSYMIYQAKVAGASLILLIVAVLTQKQLTEYLKLADALGLAVLVEVHNRIELKIALNSGAKMIGVNNRNLNDFTVNLNNSLNLRPMVPDDIPFITESGIKTVTDIKELKEACVNGVLIGETFMKASNKPKIINEFRSV